MIVKFQKKTYQKKKLLITIDDKIRDENTEYKINREAAKTSVLLSGKTDNYKYLTEKALLTPDQSRFTEQAKFTYFLSVNHLKNK